ncbi:MAG TPA: hypothetical protein VEL75_21725 [Candidatus Methylomirabilis sp.]|nr:hypothetical protein [Candidatus Methylomirabilis sp.]
MDLLKSARPKLYVGDQLRRDEDRSRRWATWGNVGLLVTAIVLPFGWIVPVVQLARVRSARRARQS